jgi:hypothetical protein
LPLPMHSTSGHGRNKPKNGGSQGSEPAKLLI